MKKFIEEGTVVEETKKDCPEEEKKSIVKQRRDNMKVAGVNDDELKKVLESLTTTIKVIGCGGAGTNTITRCFGEGINGADLIALNTDAQHLLISNAPYKILIGRHLTRGLGAGSLPQIGEEAAKESEQDIRD